MTKAKTELDPEGLQRLALAVVLRAMAETAEGNQAAKAWLETEGLAWLEVVGFEVQPAELGRWMQKGCKMTAQRRVTTRKTADKRQAFELAPA